MQMFFTVASLEDQEAAAVLSVHTRVVRGPGFQESGSISMEANE